jgi:hypothetical protein
MPTQTVTQKALESLAHQFRDPTISRITDANAPNPGPFRPMALTDFNRKV